MLFREWAPAAQSVSLIGDFNNWNLKENVCEKLDNGIFEVFIPDDTEYVPSVPHHQKSPLPPLQGEGGHHDGR